MRIFWTLFWGVLVLIGLFFLLDRAGLYGWARASIMLGGVVGTMHTIYNYEDIACTCDDPDHEH